MVNEIKITLRDATIDDRDALHPLNQANLPHVGSVSPEEFEYLLSEAAYCRTAVVSGVLGGFLLAFDPTAAYDSPNFLWFREHYDSFAYIDRIIVSSNARRKGIASLLYDDLIDFAADRGIPWIACEYNLRPPNDVSKRFHDSYGFREVGQQDTEGGKKRVSLQVRPVRA
ncbi:hypothetical protein D3OALGA1CA_3465 [Olavius algarvensis associated proteobacterium Delta 3]|nr:hypothetical protein D3OALGB2SA_3837 [Olavius algarvensis associated proteobacterium Delta 3]CAB5134791.1 hypothetical protein D3OALGA1CA_3465 [Olavius algarvensis associated proteobacterium Delta 3]